MTGLFEYPKRALFGRFVPKEKIYRNSKLTTAQKSLFISCIDKIIWKYKLAPETVNLSATSIVSEIQIFSIRLKEAKTNFDILRCIDNAVPSAIIFELEYENKCKAVACYKRPHASNSLQWNISDYFESEWMALDTQRLPLPVALNLEALYEELLSPLVPYEIIDRGEKLQRRIERVEEIRDKERLIERLRREIRRESHFNRQVEMNAKIRTLTAEIEHMKGL